MLVAAGSVCASSRVCMSATGVGGWPAAAAEQHKSCGIKPTVSSLPIWTARACRAEHFKFVYFKFSPSRGRRKKSLDKLEAFYCRILMAFKPPLSLTYIDKKQNLFVAQFLQKKWVKSGQKLAKTPRCKCVTNDISNRNFLVVPETNLD